MPIREANLTDINTIHKLANEIWWPTYRTVLSDEQISFMLDAGYNEKALLQQMAEGVTFLIAERENQAVGFAGYKSEHSGANFYKLLKLYVLPSEQGKGTGKKMVQYVMEICKAARVEVLELNVNRDNPALGFYKALGFKIYREVDIPYHGFVLNDYVLRIGIC
jgi:ribosomal protein S18 acetylase RimI-like enzyme